jgi:hypothetical protein
MRGLLVPALLVCGTGHLVFGAVDWELEITDGTNSALINSSGTLVLTNSASGTASANMSQGVYTFNGTVGNYGVNVSTGEGSPFLSIGSLDLNSADATSSSSTVSGPLMIEWSENGITTIDNSWTMGFGGTFTSGLGSTVSYSAYESNSNGFFATTNTIGTITPTPGGGGSFSGSTGGAVPGVTTPASLTEIVTLNGGGSTNYSGDANLAPAPEPAGVALWGSVILATVVALRRRRVMKKALVD